MLDSEKKGIENTQYILKIRDLLNLSDIKQGTSLKDLYSFDVCRKIYELMASGFTIDVDPNISEEMGVWGIFRYLNVVHSKKVILIFLLWRVLNQKQEIVLMNHLHIFVEYIMET
jgi:hypothetical protein